VKIDTTEVTVWYKIGTIAKQIYNFPLARMGFELVIIDKKKFEEFRFTNISIYILKLGGSDFFRKCVKIS